VLTVESKDPDSSVTVTVNPRDVTGQQNGTTPFTRLYEAGEVVTLTASNPESPGNTLKQWLLDGTPISTNATITVTMLRDTTVTAVYGADIPVVDHTLTVNSVNPGSGVPIQISKPDLNSQRDGSTEFLRLYGYGTALTATAPLTAPGGNRFQHWLLDGNLYMLAEVPPDSLQYIRLGHPGQNHPSDAKTGILDVHGYSSEISAEPSDGQLKVPLLVGSGIH